MMDMEDTYVYANPNPQLAMSQKSIMLGLINLMAYHSLTEETQERPLSAVIRSVGVDRPSPVCVSL